MIDFLCCTCKLCDGKGKSRDFECVLLLLYLMLLLLLWFLQGTP